MRKATIEDIDTPEKKVRGKQKYIVIASFAHPIGVFNEGTELTEDDVPIGFLKGYTKKGYLKKNGFIK